MRVPEKPLSPGWLRALYLSALGLTLSALAWSPILLLYPSVQNGDGQYYFRVIEAAKVSILRYRELPLWNPYECGGLPLWDNPQSIVGAPLVILGLSLRTTWVLTLYYIVHSAIGFVGMWILCRHEFKLTRAATLAGSALWAFGVAHASQYAGGHTALVPFLYVPIALFLWRRAESSLDMAVGLGLLYALMFYEGAVYPIPHISLLLAAETLTRAYPPRRVLLILRAGLVAGLVAFTISAARMLPVIDQLRHHTRALDPETDSLLRWTTLRDMWLARSHPWHVEGQTYVWGEYIAYMGIAVMGLALVGMCLSGRSRLWFLALGVFVFALLLGHFAPQAPWSLLKGHVFPYKSMRVPARFRLIFALFIATYAGIAVDRLPLLLPRIPRVGSLKSVAIWRLLVVSMAMVGVGDVMGTAGEVIASKWGAPAEERVVPSTRLFLEGPGLAQFIDQPRQNRGRLACWDEWNFTAGAPLWTGDVPQARAADDGAVVEVANRTPNTFTLDVDVKRDGARVLVNGAWDRGWRTSVGALASQNKQIVLTLPAGRHRVKLRYWPEGLDAGIALTITGIAGVLLFFTRRRWWPRLRRARVRPS